MSGVELFIGGVRFAGFDSGIHYSEVKTLEQPRFSYEPGTYEVSCEMTMSAEAHRSLLDALIPRNRGASDATLAKRASYRGGRKSRRAFARLRAKGFVGIATMNGGPPFPLPPYHVELQTEPPDPWRVFDEAVERSRRLLEEALDRPAFDDLEAKSAFVDLEEKLRRELNSVLLGELAELGDAPPPGAVDG